MRRDTLLGWLPALIAAVMLAGGGASAAPAPMAILCSGGSAEIPGQPMQRDCDKACHAGCERRKRR